MAVGSTASKASFLRQLFLRIRDLENESLLGRSPGERRFGRAWRLVEDVHLKRKKVTVPRTFRGLLDVCLFASRALEV